MTQIYNYHFNRRIRADLVALFFILAAFAFCYPLLQNLYTSCRGDWDYYSFLQEVPAISLFEYGQFPLWNPYCGGGMPLLGNPQAAFPSPISLFTSIFGVFAGLKIAVFFHTFLGLWGMWLLSGFMGVKGPARLLTSAIFMFNGTWVLHLAEGHFDWLSAAFLPFLFLGYLKSCENKWWLLFSAIVESFMFLEGGAYVFAYCLLFIFVYGCLRAIETKNMQPVIAVIFINIIAALLCAPKILPVLGLLNSNPRIMDAGRSLHWDDIISLFIEHERSLDAFGVWEYGSYLGISVVVFYIASLSLIKKHQALVLASIFTLLLAMGNFSELSPWTVLHKLPLWDYFQVPTRILIVFNFSVALLVGLYLGRPKSTHDKYMLFLILFIVMYIWIDLFSTNSRLFAEAPKPVKVSAFRKHKMTLVSSKLYTIDPLKTTAFWHSISSFHQPFSQKRTSDLEQFAHGAWSDQYLPLLQNQGVVNAYETIPFTRYASAINDKDYRGEFYFIGKGEVALLNWSPNKFQYHIKAQQYDRLIVNQNFWPGWHASRGVVTPYKGLLSIEVPPGEYDLTVKYLPISFVIGLIVFLAASTCIIVILLMVAHRRIKAGKLKKDPPHDCLPLP